MNLVEYLGIRGRGGGKITIYPNDNGCESIGGFNWPRMTERICEHINELFVLQKAQNFLLFERLPASQE